MKQYEAVIKAMENNGGFATLGHLYKEALNVEEVIWNTKTPFASIRRIVQVRDEFFKIKPGLWALETHRNSLPAHILEQSTQFDQLNISDNTHYHYQGLLVEIGNLRNHATFIPPQDKNRPYLNYTLGQIAKLNKFHQFTYPEIINRAKTIDVMWFNERKLPDSAFEVEHSTDMQNSLLKFVQLQDFYINLYIIADESRKKLFQTKVELHAFSDIRDRVKFLSYDQVSQWHTKISELHIAEQEIGL